MSFLQSNPGRACFGTWFVILFALTAVAPSAGQDGTDDLVEVVEFVRIAWLGHDFKGVVATSDTVRLQFPGLASSASMRPGHAARVLKEYLKSANEIAFELRNIRTVAADHRYAQMVRRYVVQGTSDERVETVFLGFRRIAGQWRLREIRVTP